MLVTARIVITYNFILCNIDYVQNSTIKRYRCHHTGIDIFEFKLDIYELSWNALTSMGFLIFVFLQKSAGC